MKTEIYLHGLLAEKFGHKYEFYNLKKPADFLSAVSTIHPNFLEEIKIQSSSGKNYEMLVNDKEIITPKNCLTKQNVKKIDIVPSIAVSDVGTIIAYIVVAFIAAGVAYLLAPKPQYNVQDIESTIATKSFLFGTFENTTRQGVPVPVGYGRLRIGSKVISSIIRNVDNNALGPGTQASDDALIDQRSSIDYSNYYNQGR